jgi:hypothetical protein
MALSDTREGRDLARLLGSFDADTTRLRDAMAAEAALPLVARLARWLEREGIASADSSADLAERIITASGEDKAAAWLEDADGSQALRSAAAGIAALACLGDAGWAEEDCRHGHGRRSWPA